MCVERVCLCVMERVLVCVFIIEYLCIICVSITGSVCVMKGEIVMYVSIVKYLVCMCSY